MKESSRVGLTLATMVALAILLNGVARAQTPQPNPASQVAVTSFGLTPRPMPPWFRFLPKPVINAWVVNHNERDMTLHAWTLWGAVTSPTAEQFRGIQAPVYVTWWPQQDVFAVQPQLSQLAVSTHGIHFDRPHQFNRTKHQETVSSDGMVLPGNQSISVTVQYNNPIFLQVRQNQYYLTSVLQSINDSWGATPIALQNLAPFPNNSVMTKPTYLFAYANQATQLQYWTGPANSNAPSSPAYGSWTDWMWVLPPGMSTSQFRQAHNDGHPVVSVNDFFHFPLAAEDFQPNSILSASGFAPGDFALLVAMHVASREIDNWTWQTFWWSLTPTTIPQSIAPRIKPPFSHYQVAVGYSFTNDNTESALPTLCYDPYLEAAFDNSSFVKPGQLGIESNCMSCHRSATWPSIAPASAPSGTVNPGYIANGLIDAGEPYLFAGQTKTDFVWGVQNNVPPPPP
jgi:hypothetical protein